MRTPLLVFVLAAAFVDGPARGGDPPLRPVSDEAAWERLQPKAPPLPAWARSLVTALPKTTGAMLDLDRIHRAENPLGAVLAAKLRWLAADTLGCEAAKRSTEADLKRAGLTDAEVDEFTLATRPTAAEKPLFLFARKLSRAAYTVTDAEFAAVLKAHGPEKTCAVVHTLAFANFHFRILQALGIPADADPTLPPLTIAFDPALRAKVESPARPAWATLAAAKQPRVPALHRWTDDDDELPDVFAAMDRQKERKPRIPLPDKAKFADLPPPAKFQAENIAWMTVSQGYQPKMTEAWFLALRAFQSEAKFDRVFSNSVFWVVTRTNECFY